LPVTSPSEILKFRAVARKDSYPSDGSDEDDTYAKFSPSASCEIPVASPELIGELNPGESTCRQGMSRLMTGFDRNSENQLAGQIRRGTQPQAAGMPAAKREAAELVLLRAGMKPLRCRI
jgi:hypothetical protein